MTNDQIQSFLLQKGKHLPQKRIYKLSEQLKEIDDDSANRVLSSPTKNPTLYTLFYWFLPLMWIIDRFFTGQYFSGLIKLLFPLVFSILLIVFKSEHSDVFIGDKNLETWIALAIIIIFPIWVLIDGFTISNRIKRHNYNCIIQTLK